jgi:hypothetical protein
MNSPSPKDPPPPPLLVLQPPMEEMKEPELLVEMPKSKKLVMPVIRRKSPSPETSPRKEGASSEDSVPVEAATGESSLISCTLFNHLLRYVGGPPPPPPPPGSFKGPPPPPPPFGKTLMPGKAVVKPSVALKVFIKTKMAGQQFSNFLSAIPMESYSN